MRCQRRIIESHLYGQTLTEMSTFARPPAKNSLMRQSAATSSEVVRPRWLLQNTKNGQRYPSYCGPPYTACGVAILSSVTSVHAL